MAGRREFLLLVAVSYGWQLIFLALGGRMEPGLVVLYAWLPLLLAIPWALRSAIRFSSRAIERQDVSQGGVWKAFGEIAANLGALLGQVVGFSALVALGALFVFGRTLGMAGLVDILPIPSVEWFFGIFSRFYVLALVLVIILSAITYLAYFFGRMVERFQWLMSLWVYAIVLWIGLRAIPLMGSWFSWLPALRFEELYVVGGVYEFRTFLVDSGPFAALILFGFLVTLGASAILARVRLDDQAVVSMASEGDAS